MLTTLEGEKKEYCNFSKKILALVAIQQQVEMTFVSSLVLSALRKCRKKIAHMVSFRKLCSKQNKMDCKVTFESTSKRSQVHNVKSTVCVCVSWHLLLCQGPLLWSLSSSFEGAREGSLLLQSLSFISTPSHHPLGEGEGERHKQTGLAFYTSTSSLVPLLLLIPLSSAFFRGTVSPLWPENF